VGRLIIRGPAHGQAGVIDTDRFDIMTEGPRGVACQPPASRAGKFLDAIEF
jgi:hypothetical protein